MSLGRLHLDNNRWLGLLLSWATPVGLTVVLNLTGGPTSREYTFLYLGLVGILAVTFGLVPALVAALASFLLIDYYFVPPLHTFTIASEQDVVNLVVLLAAAGLVGGLGSMRRSAQVRAVSLAEKLRSANEDLERLNREQAAAAQVALRLAVTEEQLKAMEESDRARRDFLANVSHDLRTPIATILTGSTAMLEDQSITSEQRGSLVSVAGEARRLNAVVADMLDMARIEGNSLDLQLEPVNIALAVKAAVERLQRRAATREVAFDHDRSEAYVLADWARLAQVLDNLLSNADSAAPAATAISIKVDTDPPSAVVLVTDQGPGIPPELGKRVFERFVRGQGQGGTGLGLAIVRGLVEAQAGNVWIESPGPRTTIAFALPLAPLEGVGAASGVGSEAMVPDDQGGGDDQKARTDAGDQQPQR